MFCSVFTDESEPQPDRHHCRHTHTKRGFSVCGWIIDFIVCTHLDILSSTARKHGGWWHVTMDTDWMVLGGVGGYRGAEMAGVLAVPLL